MKKNYNKTAFSDLSKWIWKSGRNRKDDYAEFKVKTVFSGEKTVLRISADSEYAVFINGKYVYSGQYYDFPWYKIHDDINITKYLKKGENLCSVWVWYCGDKNFCHYINRAAVRFEIISGGKITAVSDENTPSGNIPYFKNGYRKLITMQLGYSFFADFTQKVLKLKNSVLVPDMPAETFLRPIRRLNIYKPVNSRKISDKLYDLGRETVGFPFIKAVIPFGKTVVISFGEWLDGEIVPRFIGSRDFSFTLKGDGKPVFFANYLRKIGCRYFGVEGDCEISEIGIIPCEYPFIENPTVLSGERREIYDVAVKTLKLNAFERYFDCPWREQGFYGLDGMLQMRYGYSAFSDCKFQYGALKLMSEDKSPSGMLSITVPTSDKTVIPSFALFYVIAMQEYANFTGDLRLIRKYYPKIKGITEKFLYNVKGGLCAKFSGRKMWNFYEWNENLAGDCSANFDAALTLNLILELLSVVKICEKLALPDDAKYYLSMIDKLKNAVNKFFFDKDTGLYKLNERDAVFSELVNSYAVLTETAGKKKSEFICSMLAKKDNGMIKCTLSMRAFKYDAMLKVDRARYKEVILSEIDETYSYMLKNGATSFWETVKGKDDFNGAGSLCHGWCALPVRYYKILLEEER